MPQETMNEEQAKLEALVLEGLESGEPAEMTAEDWAELKRRVWQRHAEKEQT